MWKVAYWLLRNVADVCKFRVFRHPNYRGVLQMYGCCVEALLQRMPVEIPQEIGEYEYGKDWSEYMRLVSGFGFGF